MKIAIKTLGCKSNRSDSDKLAEKLSEKFGGRVDVFEINNAEDRIAEVDICIVNTCTVTHIADRKSRSAIGLFRRLYPNAKIVVFGCGPRVDRSSFEEISGIDFIAEDIDEILDYLEVDEAGLSCDERVTGVRTRAVVKIQDGCNNFCTYCIIPFARGREKSFPVEEILDEIEKKVAQGYKEIVLTGINIGAWNGTGSWKGMDLADLIMKILDETKVLRLRLSSIEPQNFVEGFRRLLCDLKYSDRFCPHLHMSLQSGSDSVLKVMKRRYGVELFKKVAQDLREMNPDLALTTDVIVGFPGETDGDFEASCNLVREIGFAKVHVFPYSKRAGTKAALMDGQIPEQTKKQRAKKLQKLTGELRLEFFESQIGKVWPVLIEQEVGDGIWEGVTPNYIKVRVASGEDLRNKIVDVRLEKFSKTKAAFVSGQCV